MCFAVNDRARMVQYYQVVRIEGEEQLAHWNGEQWEMDAICDSINEMLRYGLIDVGAIQGWIDTRHQRH